MISTRATPSRGSSRNDNPHNHRQDEQDEGQEEHCQRRARRISILSGLFSRRRHGHNSPPSLSLSRPSPPSPSKQKTRLSKRRRSRSPKRQRDDKTGRSSFLPQYVDDGLEASNPFLFDDTIHEEQPYLVPTVPNSPQPCQHQLPATAGITATEDGDFDFELNYLKDEDQREIIMFLVRHGEAAHNIKEREAKMRAKEMSVREGLSADDPLTLERMESARKSVLADETLRDAQLSDKGRKEAQEAHEKLQTILSEHPELPRPNYVVVSPLTRTLETCDIIFPDHDDIHVRSAIAERKTLKPPDTRSHVSQLSQRKSFQHFSMNELRVESMNNLEDGGSNGDGSTQQQNNKDTNSYSGDCTFCNGKGSKQVSTQEIVLMNEDTEDPNANWANWATPADQWKEEDKAELRRRTGRIAELLAESDSTSVAVVTHKGYLRELERGPLSNPDAKEFKNAEIRIYKITFSVSEQKMIKSERLI